MDQSRKPEHYIRVTLIKSFGAASKRLIPNRRGRYATALSCPDSSIAKSLKMLA